MGEFGFGRMKMSFDEFDYADNCNDEKRMLDAELEGEEDLK